MRPLFFLIAVLVYAATPTSVVACSCNGTQSIGGALATAQTVVIGRIKAHMALESPYYVKATVIEIVDSLKGGLKGEAKIVDSICYQSFYAKGLNIGTEYIFPLTEIDSSDPFYFPGSVVGDRPPDRDWPMFGLPPCSHTALLLDGRELYTNELIAGGGRKLEYYMNLSPMKFLFAAGLINLWEGIVIFALLTGTFVAFVLTRRRLNRSRV